MNLPVTALAAVFILTAVRQVGSLKLQIWQIMLAGALVVLLTAGGGAPDLMALAAGSTIAGNLTILGAASNVIIIQSAEQRKGETITFLEFARVGVPLTIVNGTIYWLFLKYL